MGWLSEIKETKTPKRTIRKMKRRSKRINQIRHAKKRSIERYGIVLDMADAVKQIRAGKAEFLERQSNRVSIWRIHQQGHNIPIVYDKLRHVIVTCLPLEYQAESTV